MAAEVGRAWVSILPSAQGFSSHLQKQVVPASEKAGKASGTRFGSFFTKASVGPLRAFGEAAAGIFAAEKIGEFFKSSIEEARQSQQVAAQTAQVIKTTGGAAGVTAVQVGDLANAISKKAGVDDEAIQTGENLLLTFTNIRNEAGRGNDVFNQATQTITDMSAALGQDLKSSAIQVGKALNDPVKGVTALQRVGVSFTDQQKTQIATMVKSGHTLNAQKLILGELGKEFGGAAAATATSGMKMSVAFGNLKESIGTALLPVLDRAENALVSRVIPALSDGAAAVGRFLHGLAANTTIRAAFSNIADGISATVGAVKNIAVAMAPFLKDLALIGGASIVAGLVGTAAVFDALAHSVEAVTGFFADNRTAAALLAVVLTASLAPAIAGTVAGLGALAFEKIASGVYTATYALSTLVGSFRSAEAAAESLAAVEGALSFGVAGAGIAALAFGILSEAQAAQKAKSAVDSYVQSLNTNYNSAQSVALSEQALNDKLAARIALVKQNAIEAAKTTHSGVHWDSEGGRKELAAVQAQFVRNDAAVKEYRSQLAAMQASSAKANTTTRLLTGTLGVHRAAVVKAANAVGVQLKDGYAAVAPKIQAYIAQAKISHQPTRAAAAAMKDLGNKANDVTADIQDLDTAWSNLVGNFVGAKVAQAQARDQLQALKKALKDSGGQLSVNTAKGRVAIEALGSYTDSVKTTIDAVYQQTGSYKKAAAAGQDLVDRLTHTLPKGSAITKKVIDSMTKDLQSLADKAPGLGSKTSTGFAAGIGGGKGAAQGAAQGVVGAVKSALGRNSGVSSEGVSLVQGFAAGMSSNNALVAIASAAAVVITSAINALHHHGKGGSPYKRFVPEGTFATQGFAVGMNSAPARASVSKAAGAVVRISLDAITKAGGTVSKVAGRFATQIGNGLQRITSAASNVPKQIGSFWKQIAASGQRQSTVLGHQLDAVTSRFQKTAAAAKQMQADIKSSLTQNAGLSNLDMGTATSAVGLVAGVGVQLSNIREFTRDLGLARKHGLSKALYNQILAMGPEAGLPILKDLLADPRQIRRLNREQASIDRITSRFAKDSADAKYAATLKEELGEIRNVKGELKTLNHNVRTIGQQVVNAEHRIQREQKSKARTKTGAGK